MDSFKFVYLEASDNLKVKPCQKLLLRIEEAGSSNYLNLSGLEFTNDVCKAIGQALAKDVHIRELDFSNCMLPDEGLISILLGLEKNTFLFSLNLKGNNIRHSGVQEIGKLLRHNNHL
ncbi:Leucine-rich repeat-containing protein 45, partial [Stegodyphus mimosarum]